MPGYNVRVPHPSQYYRDGWDVNPSPALHAQNRKPTLASQRPGGFYLLFEMFRLLRVAYPIIPEHTTSHPQQQQRQQGMFEMEVIVISSKLNLYRSLP